ncbi:MULTISPECIES: YkyB family protein [Bacillaceae]|uniref:Uncharacterized protein n=1 Tax=Evansella alkalicola TaxID=745819 RepID=A0ABS6JQM8_9BACI|nr:MULTISPECIES: YkyB family protein [Bacillaceae]MBU9720029.1 hypothetical protein [Bacillus alkalicola]
MLNPKKNSADLTSIQIALYTINKHAKTALNSSELYYLKKKAIKKLLQEHLAKKVSIEFSLNPGKGLQSSVVLVRVGTENSKYQFYFHTAVEKGDFDKLKHSGQRDDSLRNPRVHMNLESAKNIIYRYLGETRKKLQKEKKLDHIFISSYLDGRKR